MKLRIILSALCLMALIVPMSAQEAVEKAVEKIEKNPLTSVMAVREKRDPSTHEIIESSKIMQFNQVVDRKRLIEAFVKERENSVEYLASKNPPSKENYMISFRNLNGTVTQYSLSYSTDHWVLCVKTTAAKEPRHKSTGKQFNLSYKYSDRRGVPDAPSENAARLSDLTGLAASVPDSAMTLSGNMVMNAGTDSMLFLNGTFRYLPFAKNR